MLASAAAILLAGGLIGATGIGGVLVVPVLTQLQGLPLAQAVAASSLAFALPGVSALWWLHRTREAPSSGHVAGLASRLTGLVLGALPGAAAGSLLVHAVDARWLLAGLATLACGTGWRGLRPQAALALPAAPLPVAALALLGALVGTGSALTGTGGPVLLIPLLMLLRQPMGLTLAAAQVVQLPVALCASAVHLAAGTVPVALACLTGAVLLLGSLLGQQASRHINTLWLGRTVSALLLATGLWLGWRALAAWNLTIF